LAQLPRADLLPEAWIAPPQVRALRALLRHRIQPVRLRTLLGNRIHAVAGKVTQGSCCAACPGRGGAAPQRASPTEMPRSAAPAGAWAL